MNGKRKVRNFLKISNTFISSIATTLNNKNLFVCDNSEGFREFNIRTHKQVKNFEVNSQICVITYDNKFLFTSQSRKNTKFTKYSIQEKQQLHTWNSNIDKMLCS